MANSFLLKKAIHQVKGLLSEANVSLSHNFEAEYSLHYGIKHRFKDTNIILQGGVDDIWFNTKSKELVIADYKSQHKKEGVSQETYFEDPYKEGYQRQLDYYAYVLK